MDLPRFDVQGTGPQGVGGIPPEGFASGANNPEANAARMLRDATIKPEDSQAAQEVLTREADEMAQQLGLQVDSPSQAPGQQQAAPPAGQPQQPQPAGAAAPGALPPESGPVDPIRQKIREFRHKYGGSFTNIAAAHAETVAEVQDKDEQLRKLNEKFEGLQAQMSALLTPQPQQPRQESYAQPQSAGNGAGGAEGQAPATGDFWANPEANIGRIVQDALDQREAVRTHQQEVEGFNQYVAENKAELDNLMPRMTQMYVKRRGAFDKLGPIDSLKILHETARGQVAYETAQRFYKDLEGLDGANAVSNPAAGGVPMGALPMGGAGSRVPGNQPNAPANGDWSNTRSMQRLWRSPSGSVDETRSIMDVLKERGFGE